MTLVINAYDYSDHGNIEGCEIDLVAFVGDEIYITLTSVKHV